MSQHLLHNEAIRYFENDQGILLSGTDECPKPVLDLDPNHPDMLAAYQDGDKVHTWFGAEVMAQDAFQDHEENQPLFKLNQLNGLPVVSFQERSFLKLTHNITYKCVLVIYKNFKDTNAHVLFSSTSYAHWNAYKGSMAAPSNSPFIHAVNSSDLYLDEDGPLPITNQWLKDNYLLKVVNSTTPLSLSYIGAHLGKSLFINTDVARILAFDVRLTQAQIQKKISELMDLYQIKNQLPFSFAAPPAPILDLDAGSAKMQTTYQDGDKVPTWFNTIEGQLSPYQEVEANQPIYKVDSDTGRASIQFGEPRFFKFLHSVVPQTTIMLMKHPVGLNQCIFSNYAHSPYVIHNNTVSSGSGSFFQYDSTASVFINAQGPFDGTHQWTEQPNGLILTMDTSYRAGVLFLGASQGVSNFFPGEITRLLVYPERLNLIQISLKVTELINTYGIL